MRNIYATISEDTETHVIDALVYEEGGGRIIHVTPEQTPAFSSVAESEQRLRSCYPDVIFVNERTFHATYRSEGYRLPGAWSLYSQLLCECGAGLRFAPGNQTVRTAPYGALSHYFYHCSACRKTYCCGMTVGKPEAPPEWEVKRWGGKYADCEQPKQIAPGNPHGFRETVLFQKDSPDAAVGPMEGYE